MGGTLEFIEIVKVKFATNLPAKMVAAAASFGVGLSVRNGRNVPFELRNPNTPFVLDPACASQRGAPTRFGGHRNQGDFMLELSPATSTDEYRLVTVNNDKHVTPCPRSRRSSAARSAGAPNAVARFRPNTGNQFSQ